MVVAETLAGIGLTTLGFGTKIGATGTMLHAGAEVHLRPAGPLLCATLHTRVLTSARAEVLFHDGHRYGRRGRLAGAVGATEGPGASRRFDSQSQGWGREAQEERRRHRGSSNSEPCTSMLEGAFERPSFAQRIIGEETER